MTQGHGVRKRSNKEAKMREGTEQTGSPDARVQSVRVVGPARTVRILVGLALALGLLLALWPYLIVLIRLACYGI